jgi:hypothetical protein
VQPGNCEDGKKLHYHLVRVAVGGSWGQWTCITTTCHVLGFWAGAPSMSRRQVSLVYWW